MVSQAAITLQYPLSARYIYWVKTLCNHNRTKISLLKHRWWSHTIQFHHLFNRSPSATSLPHIPRNGYEGHFVFPLIAFRLRRNLRDLLVQANLNATCYETPGNCLCRAAGCRICLILTATDEFTSHTTGQKFKMKFTASCKSLNIDYLINCRRCDQQYVGEIGQPLHCRINNHCYNIAHRRTEESSVEENTSLTMDTLKWTWLPWW